MTHDATHVDSYVTGDRRVTIIELDIHDLDQDGFESFDFSDVTGVTNPIEVQTVGRKGDLAHNVNWDFNNGGLQVVKFNGADTPAGTNVGVFRIRIVGDR